MSRLPRILICDDDQLIHLGVKRLLKDQFEARSAYNTDEALVILRKESVDLILLDIQMRTANEGLQGLPRFRELDPELPIVVMSGLTDFRAVRQAMKLGAADYIAKEFEQNDLAHVLGRVLENRKLLKRNAQQSSEVSRSQRQHVLIGESPAIRNLKKVIEKIRSHPANVLIHGETGTGKEVVARLLRQTLPGGGGLAPFVAIDSATIQSSTAESLLFGHEKGAFTGAEKTTKGIFEEADGGIVYFDEIANMPLEIQAKLLRVLQEKEITRMGSSRILPLEFRVVCASNKDLNGMVAEGKFKDDLLQRLSVIPIEIPPLRERIDDLPILIEHLVKKELRLLGALESQARIRFTDHAIQCLQGYPWPGNVRELGNLVSYLIAMTEGSEIDISDLPPKFRDPARKPIAAPTLGSASPAPDFYSRVAEFEKNVLSAEYKSHAGNVGKMALALGMDRSHLYSKLKQHGIHAARGGAGS